MGLVVDTNIFIDTENGRLNLDTLNALPDWDESYIAAVTVSELLVGVHLAKTDTIRIKRSAFVEGIIVNMPVLDFNEKIAKSYAQLYALVLKSKAKASTNVHDLQIAATCIALGHSILTSNVSDFKKIPGLNIVTPIDVLPSLKEGDS